MERKLPLFLSLSFIGLTLTAPSVSRAENVLAKTFRIVTTEAGTPYKILLPSLIEPATAGVITQGAAAATQSAVTAATIQGLNTAQFIAPIVNTQGLTAAQAAGVAQLPLAVAQQATAPYELTLTQGLRNGATVYTIPYEELKDYFQHALDQASPMEVYQQMLLLQKSVDNTENFFLSFLKAVYFRNFAMGTPHTRALFERVAAQNDPDFEVRFLERFAFLASVKDQVATAFSKKFDSTQLRIRYIHDLDFLTPENFKPEDLLLSVEQKMSPSLKRNFFKHITGETKIKINHQPYRIYSFRGPLEKIDELYKYLVNGNTRSTQMYLTIDHPRRALFLYNADRSIWLRVTPHEFSYFKRLHLHVHTALSFTFKVGEKFVQDRVLLNLSIPVATPKTLPEGDRNEVLFNLFVGGPAERLRALPGVTVLEKK